VNVFLSKKPSFFRLYYAKKRIDIVRTYQLYRQQDETLHEGKPMQPTESSESRGQTRDININIRVKRSQRDLIDQAAELLGKTRSDFMLETACREAEDVLLDQCLFTLNADKFKEFQALLDKPPGENPKLRKLMATPAPW